MWASELGAGPGQQLPGQSLVRLSLLSSVEVTDFLVTFPLPSVSLASTSTVADAYRWLNHTVGNKTVVDEGYYYLNNFDNILNSFGECRGHRRDSPRAHCLGHHGPQTRPSRAVGGLPSPSCLRHFPESSGASVGPVVCPAAGVQARSQHPLPTRFHSWEQRCFMLCWEGDSLRLGNPPPSHNPTVAGWDSHTSPPQCPALTPAPSSGPRSATPGFHGEAGAGAGAGHSSRGRGAPHGIPALHPRPTPSPGWSQAAEVEARPLGARPRWQHSLQGGRLGGAWNTQSKLADGDATI